MSLEKSYQELKKTGLMDRKKALGWKAHRHLLKLERREDEIKNPPKKVPRKPRKKYYKQPLHIQMPKLKVHDRYFEMSVIINSALMKYKFVDYQSAMLFRRMYGIEKQSLEEIFKNKDLKWYKET